MAESRFVYVTYIRTTPAKLWQALTDNAFVVQFWCGTTHECDWKPGSPWSIRKPDGTVCDSGEVLESIPEKKLVLKWRNEFKPELKAEGYSRMTYEIEPVSAIGCENTPTSAASVKLTIIHEIEKPDSKLIQAVSNGWPHIIASLKSLLETGESLVETRNWPKGV
jgi:uncharacterized protein YndB with AHSA1/START domain